MKKPRIIILMHYLELGGAELSLIGLLNALDPEKVEVDLFLYSHRGELMKFIPDWVNLLPEIPEYNALERPLSYVIKHNLLKNLYNKIKRKIILKRYLKKKPGYEAVASHIYMDCEIKNLPALHHLGEYNAAISFLDPPHVAQDKVLAKKRIEWIHTDFAAIKYDSELTAKRWGKNDYIISISDEIKKNFLTIFPELKNKLITIENILSPEFIKNRANEFEVNFLINDFKILSIGRYVHAKNFDNVPIIAKKIIEAGIKNLKWYIIGFGGDENLIKEKIMEVGMENHVILLGKKENPYPYIKACDIYVQPSRYEGKSIAVREAQILCKPVVITNYPTAKSQVRDGIDGIIVPMDNEGCAKGIVDLINNPEKQMLLSKNCSKDDFGNQSENEKFYKIINNFHKLNSNQ